MIIKRNHGLLVIVILVLFGSSSVFYTYKKENADQTKTKVRKMGNYAPDIRSFDEFKALQGEPLSEKFNDVWSLKLVYDIAAAKLYFINSPRFRFHYEFCTRVLKDDSPLDQFNVYNYGDSKERKYYLANLNYYTRSQTYALEFVSDDRIDGGQITTLFESIKTHSYIGGALRVLVSSGYLADMDHAGMLRVPTIYPSDIYLGQQYQSLNIGTTYGYLRKIDDLNKRYKSIQENDIIIIKGTPVNVPICAGIITNTYQTPLSHINILCHNRNIPSAADVNIWKNKQFNIYKDKPVKLVVTNDSVHIELSSNKEVEAYLVARSARKVITLKYNLIPRKIFSVQDFDMSDKDIIGNKAAGLGELNKVARGGDSGFKIPEGAFAIPFFFYHQHIQQPKIRAMIEALMQMNEMSSRDSIRQQLKLIRKAIKEKPVDKGLLDAVEAKIRSGNAGRSYRFRSSSNAEDRDGFSGAGLYDSKTGILDDTVKSIAHAISSVWASEWNEAAYEERAWYHINQRSGMMGILVHRNFPEEESNGVAITRNLYRKDFPGYTINVQIGETSVVSPPDSVTCEQFVCLRASELNAENNDITVDYITYSNIYEGKRILTSQQITQLYHALSEIKIHFYWKLPFLKQSDIQDYGLDVEFKFDRNKNLYIKQVRPYR